MLSTIHGALRAPVLLLLLCTALPCSAHLLNMSKARVTLLPDGEIEVRLSLDLLLTAGSREAYFALSEISQPLDDPQIMAMLEPLPGAIHLMLGGVPIPLTLRELQFPRESKDVFLDPLAWPRTELVLRGSITGLTQAPADRGLRVRYEEQFRFEEPIANTFEDVSQQRSQTRWLVTSQSSPSFDASSWYDERAPAPTEDLIDWMGLLDFARAGTLHILPAGVDHLLFVAGLCLGAASLRALVVIISLFTLSHSLTLCAMVLGWVRVPSGFVEGMILLSILWVALANLLGRSQGHGRSVVVTLFGLLHGLGFAGALLDIGLPSNALVLSLLAFNVGVEVGQLLFVLMLLGLVWSVGLVSAADSRSRPLLPVGTPTRRYGSMLIVAGVVVLIIVRLVGF